MLVAWLLVAWLLWPRSSWLDGRVGLNLPEFREGPDFFLEHIFSQRRAAELRGPFLHAREAQRCGGHPGDAGRACDLLYKFGREQIWEKLAAIFEAFGGGRLTRDLVSRAWLLVSGQSWPKAKAEVERKAAKQSRPLALRRAQKVPLPKQRRLIQAQRQARRAAMAVAKSHSKPQAKRAVTRLSQKRTARRMRQSNKQ